MEERENYVEDEMKKNRVLNQRTNVDSLKENLPKLTHNLILTPNLYSNLNQMEN